jgi:aspartyl protease family protein
LILAGAGALGLWRLYRLYPDRISSSGDQIYVLCGFGFALMVATRLIWVRRLKFGQALRYGLIWASVVAVLLLATAFKDDGVAALRRVRSSLAPASALSTGPHEMVVSRDADGSFYVMGAVDGQRVEFLFDTGSSDIVLSPADAARLNLSPKSLRFSRVYETANGPGRGAPLEVASLDVGPLHLSNVAVAVNQAPMRKSLLGMAFLNRLQSYKFLGDRLYLTWRS